MNASEQNSKFTVFGASGYIGSNLVKYLIDQGVHVNAVARGQSIDYSVDSGHLIYAAGITSDFRSRIFDTVDAHVSTLARLLQSVKFTSFTYLSSTRVYLRNGDTRENADNTVNVLNREDLYNLSKLMGESLCLAVDKPVRILRISSVYSGDFGATNFLSSIVRDACEQKELVLQSALDSERDYVELSDVLSAIRTIAEKGRQQLYNVASGENTTTGKIAETLAACTGCSIKVVDDARIDRFPQIKIDRLKEEFDFHPVHLHNRLPGLIRDYVNGK